MDEEERPVVLLAEVKVEPLENTENALESGGSSVGSPVDVNSQPRFGESSEEDIQELLDHRSCSENTRRATKNAVKILRDYMDEKSMDTNFEVLDKQTLNEVLRKFYVEARKKNGDYYKSSALGSIRFGIHRYLQSLQTNIDIRNDREFQESNRVFKAQVVKLNRQGKGEVNRSDITPEDLKKLYLSDVLSLHSAEGLQRKVFFDILMYLPGKRNRGSVREQTRESFLVGQDSSTGLKYVYPNPSLSENSLVDGKCPRMNEKPGNPRCPVSSFLKYLSKLNPMNLYLWQRAKASFKHFACEDDPVWYENAAVGHNSLGEMMTNISKLARLSKIYTNNCIRGAYVAVLDSLLEDHCKVTPSTALPGIHSQRFQHILPRMHCDDRPTMVSVTAGSYFQYPDQTNTSSYHNGVQMPSSSLSIIHKAQPHPVQIPVRSSYSKSSSVITSKSNSTEIPVSSRTNHVAGEKQTPSWEVQPDHFTSGQKQLQSPLDIHTLNHLHRSSMGSMHNQQHSPSTMAESNTQSQLSAQVFAGSYSGAVKSSVVHNQSAPLVTSEASSMSKAACSSMAGNPLTTHVLDTTSGSPAKNLAIQVYFEEIRPDCRIWKHIASGVTNADGRVPHLLTQEQFVAGKYMIRFETEAYFKENGVLSYFYPYVEIVFLIKDSSQHYHVPLLLSPFSYSTYRGS